MIPIRFWTGKFYRKAIQATASRFYFNPDPSLDRSILVAGTARSGTTWLGDIIASQLSCRTLFEPFNPIHVPDYCGFHYFQYMRPGSQNLEFDSFARKIFSGEIRNRWIDHQNERIISKYRLIKEIRANLALKWLHDSFPEVSIVFLIRHPCAVVASRMALGWATDTDIEPFLSQPELETDFLTGYLKLIENAKTSEEKHAIIWSISNLVPLKQFKPGELKVVYYENLCTQPEIEIPAIFASIRKEYTGSVPEAIKHPSQTTRETSAIVTGADIISGWEKRLSPSKIDNILRTVDEFDLSHLYGDSLLPLSNNAS